MLDVTPDISGRPVRFDLGARKYTVRELMDTWYGVEDTWFRVRAHDGNLYVLRYSPGAAQWTLEAFLREDR
jgi:hypothetical protein